MNKTEEAFKWIVDIFNKNNIIFQLSGGFAAKQYGSRRKLRDIDFDVPDKEIKKIIPDVKKYIIFGPGRFLSKTFDIPVLIRLKYHGQEIDIGGGSNSKTFSRKSNKWIKDSTNFSKFENKKICGISVPIIKPKDLINYKSKSPRREDLIDITAIKKYLILK